jgi:hypothetical protein
MLKLWPHRQGWSADCNKTPEARLDPNNAWSGGKANRWSQMRPQRENDFYYLHIGKQRVISRIKLCTEEVRYPRKYSLSIRESDDKHWELLGEYDNLDVTLERPRKIIAIKWSITEPRLEPWYDDPNRSPAWAIYDIELTEVRLFGKWWRKVITES